MVVVTRPGDRAIRRGFAVWVAFCTVVALAVLVVGIWAVVELVTWLTRQSL